MKGYWSETRANGQPLEQGTVCWVTEVEGQHPIFTYGKTVQEVLEKVTRTGATAQAELARRTAHTATPPPARRRMTADETMQATTDLANPAKAAHAITRLVEDATGIDFAAQARKNFSTLAMEWQHDHPEFFSHPGNKRLLVTEAQTLAGGDLTAVTKEILTKAFDMLSARGELLYDPAGATPSHTDDPASRGAEGATPAPSNLTTFPGGNQVQRTTERPRGARYATGTRSTSFRGGGSAVPSSTPKYTAEAIRRMPESEMRRLIESNDPDYAAACEQLYGQTSA